MFQTLSDSVCRRALLGAIVVAFGGALAGCGKMSRPKPDRGPMPDGTVRIDWPFWPVSMRVHPLTRFVRNADGLLDLELRLEFFDPDGDPTKAAGSLRVDLFDADRVGSPAISQWNIDLADLDENDLRFEDVVRTYLFKLRVEENILQRSPEVRVYFLGSDQAKMEARSAIRTG